MYYQYNIILCDIVITKATCSDFSYNRRLPAPLQLYVTSLSGKAEQQMAKNEGYRNWDLHFHPGRYDSVFSPDKLVYLSSEADPVLEVLEPHTAYVIGGLVDHNHHKGLCHVEATKLGIRTARLPIDEFINMKTRKVLAVNHVYEILALVSQGKSWKEAFLEVLPSRKEATGLEEVEGHYDEGDSRLTADNQEAPL